MKLPEEIVITGRRIRIERRYSGDIGSGRSGAYHDWSGTIKIASDPDLDQQVVGIVLLHEILECLNIQFQYDLAHPIMEGLASSLYQVLRENDLSFRER